MRHQLVAGCLALMVLGTGATCQPAPQSDPGVPEVFMLAYRDDGTGHKGAQEEIRSGGTLTVDDSFLGPDKAEIRVYGKEDPGVARLRVNGYGNGRCSAGYQGQTASATFSYIAFPQQEAVNPAGRISSLLAVYLNSQLKDCGSHLGYVGGKTVTLEYVVTSVTWKLHAEAENCCGGKGSADFTIIVTV